MPVDLYVGGSEHAVLHLLYARFWHKVLFDEGVVKHPEPFSKLVHQGMILGQSFRYYVMVDEAGNTLRELDGDDPRVVTAEEKGKLKLEDTGEPVQARETTHEVEWRSGKPHHSGSGVRLALVSEKMSKARGNVVNPDDVVREFGADSLRMYEMFMGPLEQVKPWQTSGIQGVRRFLDRVYTLGGRSVVSEPMDTETAKLVHRTVKKIGEDIEALRLNTAVSAMMILTNHLVGLERIPREALEKLLLCLAPYAPHLAEELWKNLGNASSIADQKWPSYDPALCIDDVIEAPVQVNGKVRGKVMLKREASEAEAVAAALAEPSVQQHLAGRAPSKVVYVPGRILNLIVK
jgi:leucyl-tRNA synthetase